MKRGEVYLIDFGTPRGSEPAGLGPALIIQNDAGNRASSTSIVAAISSSGIDRICPIEVRLTPPEGGVERPSKIDLGLLLTVDRTRSVRVLGTLRPETLNQVDRALAISVGLPPPPRDPEPPRSARSSAGLARIGSWRLV